MPRQSDATKAAIKNAVDIVALVGEYLPLRRAGSKYKALCPFHDDHNPSLELNPERQSFKCWSCAAGGDVFDFVQKYEHVDFPEALRMLADRAGIVLESPSVAVRAFPSEGPRSPTCWPCTPGPSRSSAKALPGRSRPCLRRAPRTDAPSVERFRLGYAPPERGWLLLEGAQARLLCRNSWKKPGLVSRTEESPGTRPRAISRSADLSHS